jgi:hypothetical protein
MSAGLRVWRVNAHAVPYDLALRIVLKVSIPLESPFDDLPELGSERFVVEEMVHA